MSLVKLMTGDSYMREKKAVNIQIGENIQRVREDARLTQEALSECIGLTPNHLSAIERGVSGISIENLQKLCMQLGVSSDRVLFGETNTGDEFALAHRLSLLPNKEKKQVMKLILELIDLISERKE